MNMTLTPRTDAEIEGWSNGLKHVADDLLCCRDTVLDTIELLFELKRERDQLKDDLAMAEVRHAAAMMHTQSIVDENTQLRKVADELANIIYFHSLRPQNSLDDYNSLPHVVAKEETK